MQIDPTVTRDLHQQTKAAEALLLNLKDIIGGDEEVAADFVEGETNLLEAVERAVLLVCQDEIHAKAIDAHIKKLKQRKERLENRAKLTRSAIAVAMKMACKDSLVTPAGTVSRKKTPEKVKVVNEAEIPGKYWVRGEPKLAKKPLLADLKALKDDDTIPGVELDPAGETIEIRV